MKARVVIEWRRALAAALRGTRLVFRFNSFLAVAVALSSLVVASARVQADTLTYTLNGGDATISGSVGTYSFNHAHWVLSATAQPSGVLSGALSLGVGVPAYFLPATVSLSISDATSGTASMTLVDPTGFTLGAFSDDASAFSPGVALLGFTAADLTADLQIGPWPEAQDMQAGFWAGGSMGGSSGAYQNFSTPGTWNAGTDTTFFSVSALTTSLGELSLSEVLAGPNGSFVIASASPSSVPEIDPAGFGSVLALVTGALGLVERRRPKAKLAA